jgi:hypothetical protein
VNPKIKNYLVILLIYFALIGLGYILTHFSIVELVFQDIVILLTGALVIAFISSSVFFSGQGISEKKGVLHTLSAVGLKFFLFLALLGIYALVRKELSWHFLLVFFVIYLSFTFYLLTTFVRVLKSKNKAEPDDKANEIN